MAFADTVLNQSRATSVSGITLPRRECYFASPGDWRDEVLYFLLPDRFSDDEADRPMLDRGNLTAARPAFADGEPWRWDRWAQSGAERFQGGTLRGITSRLDYLHDLGVTCLWIGPIFKQRGHLNTYHGYGIQDFLDVDPRFGDRRDLAELVRAAHARGLRVILDIIFNHSGSNWLYRPDAPGGPYTPYYTRGRYPFGSWRGSRGEPVAAAQSADEGVWPTELQDENRYTRAGRGSLGAGDIDDPEAEHKRSDFEDLRDFFLEDAGLLSNLAGCYKHWIALTDCDGFRIDTLKHVSLEEARNFCGAIKEFAANLGKHDFFLVGEIAGGDYDEDRYLDVLDRNLNAALDIGEMRLALTAVAKGLQHPSAYFNGFDPGKATMGSHRNLGTRHVSILDDHDHVFGEKIRFSGEAASPHQVVAGVALQLFSLGIPCIYYGTEQALGGPEAGERQWLPEWKRSDRYLREAMFGPAHPRRDGVDGLQGLDSGLAGFGPFGTSGHHCFDRQHPVYRRLAALNAVRAAYPVLRYGRQYLRPISFLSRPFAIYGPGEIVAWSRILDDEEGVCSFNAHGTEARGATVLVDADLNPVGSSLTVIANTAQAGDPAYAGPHRVGSTCLVEPARGGGACVTIEPIPPSEVVLLINHG